MALNRKTFKKAAAAAADTNLPSSYFNTVTYTGNGGTQRIGGYINRGAEFNGSSSYISLANADSILGNPAGQSISVWANFNSVTTSGFNSTVLLASNNGVGTADWQITLYDGKIYADYFDAAGAYRQRMGSTVLSANTWYHFVIVFDSTNSDIIQCYVNGSAETMTNQTSGGTFSGNIDNSSIPITIGRRDLAGGGWYMNGKIDQVRIFNKELSSSEVTTLYGETHASTTIATTDIFSDNSGVALYQLDGNANDTGGASGKFGEAAIFGTSNTSYINLGNGSSFASGLFGAKNTYSVSVWFNKSTSSLGYIFSDYANTSLNLIVSLNSSGQLEINTRYSSIDSFYTSTTLYNDGNWHNVIVTFNSATNSRISYVDGVEVDSRTANGAWNGASNQRITIGANYYTPTGIYQSSFDGKVDDVRIYSDVLTSTEVGYLYNNTTASIPTDNLEAYYKLDGDARDEQQLYDGTATNVTYAYDGTASNVTYQEATNFSPDLVWLKGRDTSGKWNVLYDSIRGATKMISSNEANAEQTYGSVTMDSNGFTLGSGFGDGNTNGENYVSWCFNAGTDAAASNTDGTITSTVKANQDAGFSIVKWTGTSAINTIGHGLNSAPELILIKPLDTSADWQVYAEPIGNNNKLALNTTSASSSSTRFDSTSPTSSVFTFRDVGISGDEIAYCFHSVDGYQKVGSYTGNGSASGPIVETGFEPAFVMIKATNLDRNWVIVDNKRGYGNNLSANTSLAEYLTSNGQGMEVQFLSNGFQIETTSSWINNNTTNYIYLAIAADPDTTTPTVENSFDVVTYTGTGSTQEIDTDFKPDLVWIKDRSGTDNHVLQDSIRGVNSVLFSNLTNAVSADTDNITSFNSNGFSIGTSTRINASGDDHVAWCWKAGDHDDNLPQINTEGSIDSVVSVNAEAGFSIVKYTTPTTNNFSVGHGLSSAPELVFFKGLNQADNWITYASTTGATKYLRLNGTDAATTSSLPFNDTSPTSTVINLGSASTFWGTSIDTIAYCFHSVSGYQKIGSYTGNGSADGPTITTGFKPRWIMVKATSDAGSWVIMDAVRDAGRGDGWYTRLVAESSAAEVDDYSSDKRYQISDTGFQVTNASNSWNGNGRSYIYLAIA